MVALVCFGGALATLGLIAWQEQARMVAAAIFALDIGGAAFAILVLGVR